MPPKASINLLAAKKNKRPVVSRRTRQTAGKLPTNVLSKTAISSIHNKNQEIINNLPEVELDYLIYNVLNRDKMMKMSVIDVNTSKVSENNICTPKDFRFGTLENNILCGCCKKTNKDCVGHMGHIDLEKSDFKIIHPFFRLSLMKVLQSVCPKCGSLLINEDILKQKNILDRINGPDRLKLISELSKSVRECPKCSEQIIYTYKATISGKEDDIDMNVFINDSPATLSINTIQTILNKISDKDAKTLGFMYSTLPKDYIMDFIPVIPICSRPYTVRDDEPKDEYLTIGYNEIVSRVTDLDNIDIDSDLKKKKESILYFYTHICNNKDGTHRLSPTDICKSISDRIKGKEGLLRGHLLGKRADFTGRTPIGPNKSLKFGDIAPPKAMQSVLTIPEIVTRYNIDKIKLLIEKNMIETYSKKGSYNLKFKITEKLKSNIKFDIGDVVYRYSMDGDIILFNRQPTLHKQSMLGYFCKFQDKYSIGLHLSSTTGHNADFDGDEGNVHMLQTVESQVEAKLIMCAKNCIMSSNASSPIASIIFNSLSGAYLLSKTVNLDSSVTDLDSIFEGKLFNEGLSKIIVSDQYKLSLKERVKELNYNLNINLNVDDSTDYDPETTTLTAGKILCSALFPEDFWYQKKDVKIIKGVLISGTLKKAVLGNSHGSIIQSLFKFYGKTVVSNFISDANFIFNWFLEIYGLTISVNNCKPSPEFNKIKNDQVEELNNEVEKLYEDIENEDIIENEVVSLIEEKKGRLDKKLKLDYLKSDNPLSIMADSGAKGKTADTGKLIGLLGQQFVNSRRPDKLITNNKRWLTTFSVNDKSIYSRGFTKNSFYQGLNPDEFFAHAQASRIGLTDTAVKTSDIGAMQRKMVKAQEDLIINYDGSVRNQNGIIYQFNYGVGFNCENMIESKDNNGVSKLSFIDLKEVVGKVNQKFNYIKDLETTLKCILLIDDVDKSDINSSSNDEGLNNLSEILGEGELDGGDDNDNDNDD